MTTDVQVDVHKLALELIAGDKRKVDELRMEVTRLERRIARFGIIRDATVAAVCGGCRGYGHVQVWHDQDDVKSETCESCKGSGASQA